MRPGYKEQQKLKIRSDETDAINRACIRIYALSCTSSSAMKVLMKFNYIQGKLDEKIYIALGGASKKSVVATNHKSGWRN